MIRVPFVCFLSFTSLPLHLSTLLVAASNQLNHSASWLGGGWVPFQASRRAILLASSFSRAKSKYVVIASGVEVRPQIVITRREWSEIFLTHGEASILPPLESSSYDTWNLSILETADPWPFLPLSKVYSFSDIFLKLSRAHASIRPYCKVRWCQEVASLLCILLLPALPLVSSSSRWLKSPPMMTWSVVKLASLIFFHKGAFSLDVLGS